MRKYLVLSLCALAALSFSCAKSNKEKLTANTLVISIDKGSVYLSTGTAQALNAICKNATSSNVDIAPEWSVDSNLGSFSPVRGKATTFTAGPGAGSGKIYASYSGIIAKTDVLITTAAASVQETLTLSVSPASVSVGTGTAVSLTATCLNSKNEAVSVTPSWSVDMNLGTFNPTKGLSTVFTAGGTDIAGNGKIYVTYPGARAEAALTVTSTTFNGKMIYSDSGLGTNISLQHWNSGSSIAEIADANGCAPDPAKYYRIIWVPGVWDVWAFSSSVNADVSTYTNLYFYARGVAGGETFKIGISDTSGKKAELSLTADLGYTLTTNWQLITIPMATFKAKTPALDLTIIQAPIYVLFDSGPAKTINIDYIYFQ